MNKVLSCMVALSSFALRIMAQTITSSPTAADAQRAAEVDQRGDEGMGFSHAMTGHHFHLFPDGGSIGSPVSYPYTASTGFADQLEHRPDSRCSRRFRYAEG
jgi:hypothetical protein